MALLWLLLLPVAGVVCEREDDQDYVDADSCLPQLADRCFQGVLTSLQCHLESKGACAKDFCSVIEEALQCASDIIDSDCKPSQGQTNFDSWMRGLRAVQEKVCSTGDEMLRVFTEFPCFNTAQFLECVEEKTRVTHVVDLLQVILNTNECNLLLIALPTCNVRANTAHSTCFISQEIINDIIYTFFTHTDCGATCHSQSQAPRVPPSSLPPVTAALVLLRATLR